MRQKQEIQQAAKQLQRLILSPQMQQALNLLQMPVMELTSLITEEMSQNPLLEWEDEEIPPLSQEIGHEMRPQRTEREEEDLKAFIENTIPHEASLYDILMNQAKEIFETQEQLALAQWIIGNIDESGFLTVPLEEIVLLSDRSIDDLIPILQIIQTFEPSGVGASSLQESLLIQLRNQHKEGSLAYQIVELGFDLMLKNRIPALAKQFRSTPHDIYQTIANEIAPLDFHPGKHYPSGHYREPTQDIIPDIMITLVEGKLVIDINRNPLPAFRVNPHYLDMLNDPATTDEVKSYLQEKLQSGKWLMRNLQERQHTLYRIGEKLVEIQGSYLKDHDGQLTPLTMKELAEHLSLHESTIARAVAHKYLSCPRGILPLKKLFTNAYTTDDGEVISSTSVKRSLREIIDREDKHSPLSDDAISNLIKEKGVACARRTVAKYRRELGIGNATQRRSHH